MITNTVRRKRRQFDEDADWLPQKDRLFVLKQPPPPPPLPPIPEQKTRTTDKEGLDRAYKTDNGFYRDPEGTLHVAGTRGGLLESDWIENYKVYGPGLVNKLGDMLGKLESGKINGRFSQHRSTLRHREHRTVQSPQRIHERQPKRS